MEMNSSLGNQDMNSQKIKNNKMLSKVPQITVFFWIIKVLCTTVGETASDFLNVNLGLGLTGTSIIAGLLLAVVLTLQFKSKKYIPGIYWLTVVLISVFGTLVTDNMTDAIGIPLEISTIVFTLLLAMTFIAWYASEKTLAIHSIFTSRREAFYWLAILFTFALGTAAGDLMAESLGLGYLVTGIIVVSVVVLDGIAYKLGLDSVLSFWIAYIMTRPLGASLGDYLSQPVKFGGLGLGATITSFIFLAAILVTVFYLAITKKDLEIKRAGIATEQAVTGRPVYVQVVAVVLVFVLAGGTGYYMRHTKLVNESITTAALAIGQDSNSIQESISLTDPTASASSGAAANTAKLGDVSAFIKIEQDMLAAVNTGDMATAKSGANDLELTWDNSQALLKPKDTAKWNEIDGTIDTVLRQVRAVNPDKTKCQDALNQSLSAFQQ